MDEALGLASLMAWKTAVVHRDEGRVTAELQRHMREAYATLARIARERRVSLRTAAFVLAVGRVGRATVLRGV
jgi:glutamate dehydrogenase (NAD(P)+)